MNKKWQKCLLLVTFNMLLVLFVGVVGGSESQKDKELKGIFLGKSYKANLISLQIGRKTLLVPYGEDTSGLDEVAKGDNVLLRYKEYGGKKKALEIVPELVTLPVGVSEIKTEDFLAIVNDKSRAGEYLLVDCRPADFYDEAHLPSAVSIPWTEAKDVKMGALPTDKKKPLIFYCLGSTCLLGPNSAAMAVEAGYKNVEVLLTELSEWQEIGGSLYSADNYVAGGNIVLVDLRSSKEAEAGHIPGAVNIAAGEISEAEYDFPSKKSAPVVVYGNSSEESAAIEIIKSWGFHLVSRVEGGYEGWAKRGNTVKTEDISSQIKWKRILGEGEVSIEKFKKILAGENENAVIVDVRTAGEAAKGGFEKAKSIPLSELEARLAEIPADKEVYLHCTTGARAKMAWTFLKQQRDQVRYLQAKVTCKRGIAGSDPELLSVEDKQAVSHNFNVWRLTFPGTLTICLVNANQNTAGGFHEYNN